MNTQQIRSNIALVATVGLLAACPATPPHVPAPRVVGPGTPSYTEEVCQGRSADWVSPNIEPALSLGDAPCSGPPTTSSTQTYIRREGTDVTTFHPALVTSTLSTNLVAGRCAIMWETTVEEPKNGEWVPASPVSGEVTLCALSLVSPLASQLEPVQLHSVEVGSASQFEHLGPLIDPTTLTPQAHPYSQCKTGGPHATVLGFDYSHRISFSVDIDDYANYAAAGVELTVSFHVPD